MTSKNYDKDSTQPIDLIELLRCVRKDGLRAHAEDVFKALEAAAEEITIQSEWKTEHIGQIIGWLRNEAAKEDYFGRKYNATKLDAAADLIVNSISAAFEQARAGSSRPSGIVRGVRAVAQLLAAQDSDVIRLKDIEGMSVSVDVSTCDADAGYRLFGEVQEVMEDPESKHGVTLLIHGAEPNFTSSIPAGYALVPVEPTSVMCVAGAKESAAKNDEPYYVYKAMIAAYGTVDATT